MERAVITGATGPIGSALIRNLIEHGVEMLVIVNPNSKRTVNIPKSPLVSLVYYDLEDLHKLQNENGKEYDIFYHFAWMGTSGSKRNDMYLQNQNVKYALDAVKAAKALGCRKFVGAGSQAEYGRYEGKLRPDTPVFPETGYGYAKLCAGLMTRDYAHRFGMEQNWVRIVSVYGPNDGEQTMVMSTIMKLINGETPQMTKGEQRWDYLYSDDAASAFRLIGENGVDGKTYVLGGGESRPLKEYVDIIRKSVSPQADVEFGTVPYAENQIMNLCADITELQKDTGWRTETLFEDGIKKILAYIGNGGATHNLSEVMAFSAAIVTLNMVRRHIYRSILNVIVLYAPTFYTEGMQND